MNKRLVIQRWIVLILPLLLMLLPMISADSDLAAHAASPPKPLQPGEQLPRIVLPPPETPEHGKYLGVTDSNPFSVSDIEAEIVIIEIFSMYCPHCQREAPIINQLYHKIENDPKDKRSMVLIGIGVGNSAFETDYFKKTYEIPFPLFPDGDFTIHKQVGEVRTPFFIVVRLKPDLPPTVIQTHAGGIDEPGKFLEAIEKKAGLE